MRQHILSLMLMACTFIPVEQGREGVIYIPTGGRLDDSITFGRVLGHIWVDGKELSQMMVEEGYATRRKTD